MKNTIGILCLCHPKVLKPNVVNQIRLKVESQFLTLTQGTGSLRLRLYIKNPGGNGIVEKER